MLKLGYRVNLKETKKVKKIVALVLTDFIYYSNLGQHLTIWQQIMAVKSQTMVYNIIEVYRKVTKVQIVEKAELILTENEKWHEPQIENNRIAFSMQTRGSEMNIELHQ